METQTTAPSSPPPRGWWSRNWKWFVPLGCFGMIVAFSAFVALIIMIVFGAMKSSDAYKEPVARAKADPRVVQALGEPIKEGYFVAGKVNVEGGSGEANLSIPISGPRSKGTLYVVAVKSAGAWNYSTLTVEVGDGKRINLLTSDKESPPGGGETAPP